MVRSKEAAISYADRAYKIQDGADARQTTHFRLERGSENRSSTLICYS